MPGPRQMLVQVSGALTQGSHGLGGLSVCFSLLHPQSGEEMEACEELALALSRGLQLDTQRSSRDSLQCSSGYSTQTTTPCCSEDTIPSQGMGQPGARRLDPRLRGLLSCPHQLGLSGGCHGKGAVCTSAAVLVTPWHAWWPLA